MGGTRGNVEPHSRPDGGSMDGKVFANCQKKKKDVCPLHCQVTCALNTAPSIFFFSRLLFLSSSDIRPLALRCLSF